MAKWTVAVIIEFEAGESDADAVAFVDDLCNESSADFIWCDTITNNNDLKLMSPDLGCDS